MPRELACQLGNSENMIEALTKLIPCYQTTVQNEMIVPTMITIPVTETIKLEFDLKE